MKPLTITLVVLVILVIISLIASQVTAVRPGMPPAREGSPEPARPQPGDPPFNRTPLAPTYDERRQLYIEWVLATPTQTDRGGVWTDIVKLAGGAQSVSPEALQDALEFVNTRQDPSDFTLNALMRLVYLNQGTGRLTAQQEADIRQAMLNYKYWLDEPNTTYVEMWTENHQLLMHSAEYLAGQLFPQEVFPNNGQTGEWHMAHARALILQWIDLRVRTGFAEWDSETYYPEDLAPLLNLADFAGDPQLATQATMMVDAILFDIAVDSFYGQYATSHGRVTASSIKSALGSVTTIAALAWGQGRFLSTNNMGAVALATSPTYQVPQVIQALALDNPAAMTNFERHSFNLEDAGRFGLNINKLEDMPRFWGIGAFTNPEVITQTIRNADSWNLWHYPDFKDLKDIAKVLQAINGLPLASRLLDPDSNGVLMSEVNKVSYRTPDYMLSTAQDFRRGEKGYQQHIWQATLSSYAVVFVTNPDSLRSDDKNRPSYWMANGRQPRAAQYQNVLITLYDLPAHPSAPRPLEMRHYAFTHAYFPRWAFDEVVEAPVKSGGGWIFGRTGEGYVALYSHLPYQWITAGPDADQELVAPGYRNVWMCQLGRAAVDGTFQEFVTAVKSAELKVNGLSVAYDAPGVGKLTFGWTGDMALDGQPVSLRGYPRWDNPYAHVPFNSTLYEINFGGHSLVLDFAKGLREEK